VTANLIADRFEAERPRLLSIAYRMLGSAAEAEDAVQEAWLRLDRQDADELDNLGGWLTTVVGRLCLDQLRVRRTRREELHDWSLPDPVIAPESGFEDPAAEALMAEAAGMALMVVLDQLTPPERLAFVLHDVFAVPFDEIATMVDRSPDAARQLASRARRRVRGATPSPDADRDVQRRVVGALLAAIRAGDVGAVVALLDEDVVLRVDPGETRRGGRRRLAGRELVAGEVVRGGASGARHCRLVLVNDSVGIAMVVNGKLLAVVGISVAGGRIVELDILADRERLARLDIPIIPRG
jgi:RNA polymerase sigma-70 factor (ECF subfamily)